MNLERAMDLRYKLHETPELSGCEIETQKILKDYIVRNSNLKIVDRGKYFYAIHYEGDSLKNIAFRADMDALPCENGAYHGCGHDGHSAVLAEFAVATEKERFGKNIFFLFQPAEETGKGAELCCKMLKEERISEIYGWHNIPGHKEGNILIRNSSFACASKGLRIIFEGKQCHAAYPETGVNPAFLIAGVVGGLSAFTERSLYRESVLATIVEIRVGDKNFGISAGTGELSMTIRAQYTDDLDRLQNRILEYCREEAEKQGISMHYEIYDEFPATVNSERLYESIENRLKENSINFERLKEPLRWSEDFGHYSKYTEAFFLGIGDGEDYAALHTPEFEFNDRIIENAVNTLSLIARK